MGETEELDFTEWRAPDELPDGWSESGLKQYTAAPLVWAAYFSGEGDAVFSRVFPKPILSVTVESATRQSVLTRRLTLTPVVDGHKQAGIELQPPTGRIYELRTVDLATSGATKFILSSGKGEGNWAVRKITVVYGEQGDPDVRPVAAVSVSGTAEDRFELAWEPVTGADGYLVNVWTNGSNAVHADVFQTNTCFVSAAEPVVYAYSVAARFTVRGEVVDSSAVVGSVDMSRPPWFRCWRLSAFMPKPGFRVASFEGIGRLTKKSAWSNGDDGDSFYAFKDMGPATSIRPATDDSVYADLYCYNAGTDESPTNGLALLGSTSTGLRLCLPIRLDLSRGLAKLALSFRACEVKAGAAERTTLSFAWTTVDDIRMMEDAGTNWTDVPSAAVVSTNGTSVRHFDVPVGALRSVPFLCFRWSVPKQAKSSIMGLSDIRVAGRLRDAGFGVMMR